MCVMLLAAQRFPLIRYPERRTILRLGLPAIVNPRRRDIRMPQPLLHLGDVGLVIERIGRRRRAQRVRPDLKPQLGRVRPYHPIHPVRRDGLSGFRIPAVVERAEEGTAVGGAVPRGLEVLGDQAARRWVQRQVARLAALARHFQMHHAAPLLAHVADFQLAELIPAQRVIEQGGQNRAITLGLHRVADGRSQELAGLVVTERRRLAFGRLGDRPLHPLDRVNRTARRGRRADAGSSSPRVPGRRARRARRSRALASRCEILPGP